MEAFAVIGLYVCFSRFGLRANEMEKEKKGEKEGRFRGVVSTTLAVALLLAIGYFFVPTAITKILPILFLSFAARSHSPSIANGLLISAVGDVLLELQGDEFIYFIGGLLSFLAAHVLYIWAYLPSAFPNLQAVPLGIVHLFYFGWLMSVLLPVLQSELVIPVVVYGTAICFMSYLGTGRFFAKKMQDNDEKQTSFSYSYLCSLFGTLFFVASDSILALDRFKAPIVRGKQLVMITYYTGQTLIALSAILAGRGNLR